VYYKIKYFSKNFYKILEYLEKICYNGKPKFEVIIRKGSVLMEAGIKGRITEKVTEANTAAAMHKGLLPVYATPAMILLMESTAFESVAPYLNEGDTTVGTGIDVKHLAASPIGAEITCESTLTAVEGRKLTFDIKAYQGEKLIGTASHERFVVNTERFMSKL